MHLPWLLFLCLFFRGLTLPKRPSSKFSCHPWRFFLGSPRINLAPCPWAPNLSLGSPGQSHWLVTVHWAASFTGLRTTRVRRSSLYVPTPDPALSGSTHGMSVYWVNELSSHHRLLQRQENWDQWCGWEVSLGMKADHTFIEDRSRAEEHKDGERLLRERGRDTWITLCQVLWFLIKKE